MLICEENLIKAVEKFIRLAALPRPEGFSRLHDRLIIENKITPAFLAALEEIEAVQLCSGFDISNVRPSERGEAWHC